MSIAANSYGSTSGVAVLTPRYANSSGVFDNLGNPPTGTRPSLSTVESQIDQISGLANSILAQYGFSVPVKQADAKLALDIFVNEEVAAIVEGINGSGRFGPTTKEPGRSRFTLIMDDLQTFIKVNVQGWTNLGVDRNVSEKASVSTGVISMDFAEHWDEDGAELDYL